MRRGTAWSTSSSSDHPPPCDTTKATIPDARAAFRLLFVVRREVVDIGVGPPAGDRQISWPTVIRQTEPLPVVCGRRKSRTDRLSIGGAQGYFRRDSLRPCVEPNGDEAKFVETAERGQVRTAEAVLGSSVGHVEVVQMRRVGTFILGRPRPLPGERRADRSTSSIVKSRE